MAPATFDVGLSLPLIGPIVRYRGWVAPASGNPAEAVHGPCVTATSP
jgi:hypothetical protein